LDFTNHPYFCKGFDNQSVKKNLANYLGFSMKVIKLFITSILLLSSFQAFATFVITTDDVSTPENIDKVIDLTVSGEGWAGGTLNFSVEDGDEDWFVIDGDKLTFKATAFRTLGDHNTYYVDIMATHSNNKCCKCLER
jgi:hypothetical protein